MFSFVNYSGLSAKIHSMDAKLLKNEDYQRLSSCRTVPEALNALKALGNYKEVFEPVEGTELHRKQIESLLTFALYDDFRKLYRFSGSEQKRFMDLYFLRYEGNILKSVLQSAFVGRSPNLDLSLFQDFFEKHSNLNLENLSACRSISDFLSVIKDTPFYQPLKRVSETERNTLFDYKICMDQVYYEIMWRGRKITGGGEVFMDTTKAFGSVIDLMNLQWIYRSKKYYNMDSSEIYALIIPFHYRLHKQDIAALVEAPNMDEFFTAFSKTYYKTYGDIVDTKSSPEVLYGRVVGRLLERLAAKNPFSVNTIQNYLFKKEQEIHRLTSLLEGIRYGLPEDRIRERVLNMIGGEEH